MELNLLIPTPNQKQRLKQEGSNILDPNAEFSALGSEKSDAPHGDNSALGSEKILDPNAELWRPPVGNLEQKWRRQIPYWYWRYYNNRGQKASLYLAKDYNRAIRKAQTIGVPTDAKNCNPSRAPTDPQTQI